MTPAHMRPEPLVLEGAVVRLEPLSLAHVDALARVGLAPELWRLQPKVIGSVDEMRAYVQAALDDQERGVSLPFAIVERDGGQVIGSTRYMDIAPAHRRQYGCQAPALDARIRSVGCAARRLQDRGAERAVARRAGTHRSGGGG